MNQEFDASGEGLAVTSRTLNPYGDRLGDLLATLSALFMKFRQRNVVVSAIAVVLTIVFLVGSIWIFSAAMDASKAVDPVNTAGQLYF